MKVGDIYKFINLLRGTGKTTKMIDQIEIALNKTEDENVLLIIPDDLAESQYLNLVIEPELIQRGLDCKRVHVITASDFLKCAVSEKRIKFVGGASYPQTNVIVDVGCYHDMLYDKIHLIEETYTKLKKYV